MKKIRLFVNEKKLEAGGEIKIADHYSKGDFNYLINVMRQKIGDQIFIFNGCDGEFQAAIRDIAKKFLILTVEKKIAEIVKPLNVTLAFALIKNVGIDFIAQKATELGVASFQPLVTKNSVVDKINLERFTSNVKEACEQCERNDFPKIFELKKLEKFLAEVETSKKVLILCDESGQGLKAGDVLSKIKSNLKKDDEIIVFVGPEGGFNEAEFLKFRALKNVYAISLGARILRADTAIISALTLVGEFLGS